MLKIENFVDGETRPKYTLRFLESYHLSVYLSQQRFQRNVDGAFEKQAYFSKGLESLCRRIFFEFFAQHSSVQNQFSNENELALQRHKNVFDIRCTSALSQEFILFSSEAYFSELRFDRFRYRNLIGHIYCSIDVFSFDSRSISEN